MSKKLIAVIKREYITRAKTKGFIIGTLMFPILLILVFGGIFIFSAIFQPSTRTYYVVDQTGQIFNEFESMFPDTLKTGELKYKFIEKVVPPVELDIAMEDYQNLVLNKRINGYLVIPEDVVESREVKYSARSVSDFEEQRDLANALSRIVTNIRLEKIGLSPEEIRKEMYLGNIRLVSLQITDEGEIEKSGVSSFVLTYFLTYIMLLMIMIYGQILMRSVIEEKTQRITETIISSIKPVELMTGKVVGICLLGLTQLVVVGVIVLALVSYGENLLTRFGVSSYELLTVVRNIQFSASVFGFLIFFFLMGFAFFAGLFAAIGAMVNTEDEGQHFQMPLIFTIIISFFIMFTVAKNPETPMAFWASLFPFFTPIVMFARIAVSDPVLPSGAYLSIFTMLASNALIIWLTAKIYRVGILMYGKKASIKEAIKWIRYK